MQVGLNNLLGMQGRINMRYKLRIYFKTGSNKGNLRKEEFFPTKELMQERYEELFNSKDYALNPTTWELIGDEWLRIF